MRMRNTGEKILDSILFNSRWILAPVYIGLVVSLLMLLTAFVTEIIHTVPQLIGMKTEVVILHLTFIASGVLFVAMDWIAALTDAGKEKEKRTSETARTSGG